MQSKQTPPPLWREEFSVFKNDERYVSRRQLTKFLTLTSMAMFAGNIWILIRSRLQGKPQTLPTAGCGAGRGDSRWRREAVPVSAAG